MRGMLLGLLVAVIILAVALLAAALGALGVGLIGLLLHRLFDLTQWQGTLIALGVAFSLGFLVYRMVSQPLDTAWQRPEDEWEAEEDEDDDDEPPVVAWRRNRPTPGALSQKKPGAARSKPH